jgi:hypothetical protein
MSWTSVYDGVFFLSLATIIAGSFGLSVRYCLRSKCEHFKLCWGIVDIDRRVDLETTIDLKEIETNKHDHAEEKKGDEAV